MTSPPNAPKPMSDKKPWGDDYVPDDRPWAFPPNALLPTEEQIQAGAVAFSLLESSNVRDIVSTIYTAMRALAKPDEGVRERVAKAIVRRLNVTPWERLPWSEQRAYLDTAAAALASLSNNDDKVG